MAAPQQFDLEKMQGLLAKLETNDLGVIEEVLRGLVSFPVPCHTIFLTDDKLAAFVLKGMSHEAVTVRTVAIRKIEDILNEMDKKDDCSNELKLIGERKWARPLLLQVAFGTLSVAETAKGVLLRIGKYEFAKEGNPAIITSEESIKTINDDVIHKPGVNFQTLSRVSAFHAVLFGSSERAFQWGFKEGFVKEIVDDFTSGKRDHDSLSLMCVIPTLTDMCTTAPCLEYYEKQGVFEKLEHHIIQNNQFLLTSLIEFVASICVMEGKINRPTTIFATSKARGLFAAILHGQDSDAQTATLHAIGLIGRASKLHLNAILEHEKLLENYTSVANPALRPGGAAVLEDKYVESLGTIFDIREIPDSEEKDSLSPLHLKLFNQIKPPQKGQEVVEYVMSFMKSSFDEKRGCAYHFFVGLASHDWGVEHLLAHPGFIDWLLNRKNEHTKEGAEWKFSLVLALKKKGDKVKERAGEIALRDIMVYVKQGIFYGEGGAGVAVGTKGM